PVSVRKRFVAGGLVLVVGVPGLLALAAWWMTRTGPSREVWEKYELLQEGMSITDVESLLGRPSGNYRLIQQGSHDCTLVVSDSWRRAPENQPVREEWWLLEGWFLLIGFDIEDKARAKTLGHTRR